MDVLGWYQTVRAFNQRTGIPLLLDDYIKRDKYDVKRFNAKELDLVGRIDGKIYSLFYAYGGNLTAYFYNRALFSQAGVAEPPADWSKAWSWDEFRDAMRRLTKKEGGTTTQIGITHYGDPVTSLLVLSDGRWVSDDWKKITSSDAELLQTFERWADLVEQGRRDHGQPGSRRRHDQQRAGVPHRARGDVRRRRRAGQPGAQVQRGGHGLGLHHEPEDEVRLSRDAVQPHPADQAGRPPRARLGAAEVPRGGEPLGGHGGALPGHPGRRQPVGQRRRSSTTPTPASRCSRRPARIARPVDKYAYHPAFGELNKVVQPVLADIWAGKASARAALPPLQSQLQGILDQFPA